jgi:hypothetical protein
MKKGCFCLALLFILAPPRFMAAQSGSEIEDSVNEIINKVLDQTQLLNNALNIYFGQTALGSSSWSAAVLDKNKVIALDPALNIGVLFVEKRKLTNNLDPDVFSDIAEIVDSIPLSVIPVPTSFGNISVYLGNLFDLPFDIGVTASIVPTMVINYASDQIASLLPVKNFDFSTNYLSVGVTGRYYLLRETEHWSEPSLSIGAGYHFTTLGLNGSFTYAEEQRLDINGVPTDVKLTNYFEGSVEHYTHTFFIRTQVSKNIFIFRPYGGLDIGISYSSTLIDLYDYATVEAPGVNEPPFIVRHRKEFTTQNLNVRLFGGVALKLGVVLWDTQVSVSPAASGIGFALSTALKIEL